MRFEKIVISNYRQYESLQLDFPQPEDTDLHVVIASNGIGKTNLLNSIDWCLYGEESHLGDKDESLSICNLKAIDEANKNKVSQVQVSVKIFAKEKSDEIVFERSVSVNPKTLVPGIENFQVIKTPLAGNTEFLEGEAADSIVNIFLPQKIKQYFFFDGEQLYNYFGKGRDTTHVKDSIHEIAQINVVSHVREHLAITCNEKQREISKLNPATERLQRELEELIANKTRLKNDIEKLENAITDAEDRISELNTKISGQESVADDDRRLKKVESELEELEKKREEIAKKLEAVVRKYYTLLMLYDVNKRTSDYINEKEIQGHLPPEINRDLLLKSLNDGKCAICNQDIGNDVKAHIEELLNKFEVSTSVSNKLMEIKNDTASACKKADLYDNEKNKIYEEMRKNENQIGETEKERQILYNKISGCSSIEEIKSWIEERENLTKLIKENNKKIGSYSTEIENIDKKIELKTHQIEDATKGEKRCYELKNQLSFVKKAFNVVKEIEDEVTSEVRSKMEKCTFDIFSSLIWKHNTYGRLELNQDYRLRLFHVHGDSCLGSCSAAERELLALAFTLALHQVSHHDSLLFIDTPVGRVSDDNREFFAKALIDVSRSKQLILAFTPSEYSEEISKHFNDNAVGFNYLNTPDETTTVLKGGKV